VFLAFRGRRAPRPGIACFGRLPGKFELSSNIMQTENSLSGNRSKARTASAAASLDGIPPQRERERDTFTALCPVRTGGAAETNWRSLPKTYSDLLRSVRIHFELILPSTN